MQLFLAPSFPASFAFPEQFASPFLLFALSFAAQDVLQFLCVFSLLLQAELFQQFLFAVSPRTQLLPSLQLLLLLLLLSQFSFALLLLIVLFPFSFVPLLFLPSLIFQLAHVCAFLLFLLQVEIQILLWPCLVYLL